MSVTMLTPERGRLALALPLILSMRESEKTEEEKNRFRELLRDSANDNSRLVELGRDGTLKQTRATPTTVEAYVIINAPKVTVQGMGDVPIYGYITYTKSGAEVEAEKRIVVVQGPANDNMGWMTTYHTNDRKAA